MDVASSLRTAAAAAGVGVPELAARSGLSRATTYRILDGQTDPRLGDLADLFRAVGLRLELTPVPMFDLAAASAARMLLEPTSAPGVRAESVDGWLTSLARRDGGAAGVVGAAGESSSVLRDPAALGLRADGWDVDRLVSAGRASGGRWALSGWAALDALGCDVVAPTIFWADDPRLVGQLLADTFASAPVATADVIVARGDDDVFAHTVDVDDVVLVDRLRALIDSAGLGGEPARIALDLAGAVR